MVSAEENYRGVFDNRIGFGRRPAVIVITNMGVSIFMFTVGPLPGIEKYMWAPTPVWTPTFWTVLGCELAVLVITFTLPFVLAARRRDFI